MGAGGGCVRRRAPGTTPALLMNCWGCKVILNEEEEEEEEEEDTVLNEEEDTLCTVLLMCCYCVANVLLMNCWGCKVTPQKSAHSRSLCSYSRSLLPP